METQTKSPIFLVGCPRSGTTLLQSLLAAHPDITSFPESHFFRHLIDNRGRVRRRLGIASKFARNRFEEFLSEIKHKEMQKYLPKYALFMSQYTKAFIKVLDTLSEKQEKSFWIEKTPDHVLYIDYIEKLIEKAKFIHIIRNGSDAVASLYEVTHKHPEIWHGEWDIDKCISHWIKCINHTHKHLHKSNHILVTYEQLIAEPESTLNRLGVFLGIKIDYQMLKSQKGIVEQIVLKNEPWKASVNQPISSKNSNKFNKIFNENQKSYIMEKLSVINLERLESLTIENVQL